MLIVGCGCRGRELAAALAADGHLVRGTTRDPARAGELSAAGVEPAVADPDRLGTLVPHLAGATVVAWLLGSARGEPDAVAALHGPRLQSLLATLVDSGVRGFVYEAAGTLDARVLAAGADAARLAGDVHRMPVALVEQPPDPPDAWLAAARAAVADVLAA